MIVQVSRDYKDVLLHANFSDPILQRTYLRHDETGFLNFRLSWLDPEAP